MSVVNQFGKLFNRKPATSDAGASAGTADDGQDLLATGALDGASLRDGYQAEAMNSVQGDPEVYNSELTVAEGEEDLIALPVLGRSTAAAHQRRLLGLLAVGVIVLALIAAWVLRQADRSAQQLAATGQALMQSQRLAKSVSQALVGSPQAFPDGERAHDEHRGGGEKHRRKRHLVIQTPSGSKVHAGLPCARGEREMRRTLSSYRMGPWQESALYAICTPRMPKSS